MFFWGEKKFEKFPFFSKKKVPPRKTAKGAGKMGKKFLVKKWSKKLQKHFKSSLEVFLGGFWPILDILFFWPFLRCFLVFFGPREACGGRQFHQKSPKHDRKGLFLMFLDRFKHLESVFDTFFGHEKKIQFFPFLVVLLCSTGVFWLLRGLLGPWKSFILTHKCIRRSLFDLFGPFYSLKKCFWDFFFEEKKKLIFLRGPLKTRKCRMSRPKPDWKSLKFDIQRSKCVFSMGGVTFPSCITWINSWSFLIFWIKMETPWTAIPGGGPWQVVR